MPAKQRQLLSMARWLLVRSVATLLIASDMQQQVTDLVLKFLRQGFTIEQIEKAFEAELETIRKSAPMLKAQKEAALAP